MDRHERLKWARQKRGYRSAAVAAEALGVPYGTYSGHENGSRGIKDPELVAYAKAFRVALPWLAYGEGSPENNKTVPLVGIIGAGGAINAIDDHEKGAGFDDVEAPPGASSSTVAAEVRGDSMPGVAEDGWLVYWDERGDPPSDRHVGKLCIVGLEDGRVLVKKLYRSKVHGLYSLISTGAEPILDVAVAWAARVSFIKPR